MNKTIHAKSGHTLFLEEVEYSDLPKKVQKFEHLNIQKTWIVHNWDKDGVVFMYIQKHAYGKRTEYVVWYRGGGFWSSYGTSFQSAIDGAQEDGWMYA